jgi:hypothetical protein
MSTISTSIYRKRPAWGYANGLDHAFPEYHHDPAGVSLGVAFKKNARVIGASWQRKA